MAKSFRPTSYRNRIWDACKNGFPNKYLHNTTFFFFIPDIFSQNNKQYKHAAQGWPHYLKSRITICAFYSSIGFNRNLLEVQNGTPDLDNMKNRAPELLNIVIRTRIWSTRIYSVSTKFVYRIQSEY